MTAFDRNPDFKAALEEFVLGMPVIQFLNMELVTIDYGMVELSFPYRDELSFAKGALQAGSVGMLVDIAASCAIGTTLPPAGAFQPWTSPQRSSPRR